MGSISTLFALALVETGRSFNDDERAMLQFFTKLLDDVIEKGLVPYFQVPFALLVAQVKHPYAFNEHDLDDLLFGFRDLLAVLHITKATDELSLNAVIFDTIITDTKKKKFILRINTDLLYATNPSLSELDDYIPLF